MAKVWFARRRGAQWVAPGGEPAFEAPLAKVLFPLDLGTHRRLDDGDKPLPAAEIEPEPPEALQRVVVEISADDLTDRAFSGYRPGIYDSALSPSAAAARLEAISSRAGGR